ncbi:GNAT family N-acetyltransferase [Muricauda sp. NFXS6]|uniref:GNAT family N-acetyltransferase n=1 Tax=Allomuricauda sp. NFXS6 TaxID=2819094 RepID=UPI0032E04379
MEIRPVQSDEVGLLYHLIQDLAKNQHLESFVETSPERLSKALFREPPDFGALLAMDKGRAVGYLTYTISYSIWAGRPFLHMDDLFVTAKERGKGIGKQLILHVRKMAMARNISSIKWEVDRDNQAAISFYQGLGAQVNIKGIGRWEFSGADHSQGTDK